MSRDSKENLLISNLYSENVVSANMVNVAPVQEAHPVDGDAGSIARSEINSLKEEIHHWVETGATENELREIINRIREVEAEQGDIGSDIPPMEGDVDTSLPPNRL